MAALWLPVEAKFYDWRLKYHLPHQHLQVTTTSLKDVSSFMDYPLSAIPQCRVALSAMTHIPHGDEAKVLAHCCKLTIDCKGFPSSPVRAAIVQ